MPLSSVLLLLLLHSSGSIVHAFTVPAPDYRSRVSPSIRSRDGTGSYHSGRLTVMSSSPKGRKPKSSGLFQPSDKKPTDPEVIVKRRLPVSSRDESSKGSKWDSFKGAVYETFDVIGEVPSKVSLAPSNDDPSSDLGIRRAPLAYSNTVGETTGPPPLLSRFLPEEPETPGEKLLKQYQSTNNIGGKKKNSSSSNNINISLDYNPVKEDDLYRSDSRKKFDSVKGGIYKSFDFIVRSGSSIGEQNKSRALLLSDSNRIRPMAKTSINKVESTGERKRQQRAKKMKRKENIQVTKETLYNVIDGIQTVGEVVVALPEKVGQTVEGTQDVLVGASVRVKDTIEGAQAFPGKVRNLVEDVRDSVEETKRITEEVSLDIKNIPKTVEGKISDTRDSIRETKEGVLNVVKRGEEAVYSAKVMAGMAKPKPKPPPPPKPKKASDIALQLTGSLVWFVAKGSTNIVVSGTKVAWSAFGPSSKRAAIKKKSNDDKVVISKAVQEMDILKSKPTVPPSKPNNPINPNAEPVVSQAKTTVLPSQPNNPINPTAEPVVSEAATTIVDVDFDFEKPTLAQLDPDLEKEVNEALRLAEEALAFLEIREKEVGVTAGDIDVALRKAKVAAARATKDAADLQELIRKRSLK